MTTALLRLACAPVLLLALDAAPALADLAPWNQEHVTSVAQQLVKATDDLYDSFFKQPKPVTTPTTRRDYDRLKRDIRHIRNVARGMAGDLKRGEGREQTQTNYESLLSAVHWAGVRANRVFTTQDVQQRAATARALLDQLAPYYAPPAKAAEP